MINFDYIGDNNRIPLVQIEIHNSQVFFPILWFPWRFLGFFR